MKFLVKDRLKVSDELFVKLAHLKIKDCVNLSKEEILITKKLAEQDVFMLTHLLVQDYMDIFEVIKRELSDTKLISEEACKKFIQKLENFILEQESFHLLDLKQETRNFLELCNIYNSDDLNILVGPEFLKRCIKDLESKFK